MDEKTIIFIDRSVCLRLTNWPLSLLGSLTFLLLFTACGNHHYYYEIEKELGTNGRVTSQHHLAAYYPSGISLNFPGYVIGLEDGRPEKVSYDGDIVIVNPPGAGRTVELISDTILTHFVPFISHIHRYEGKQYGEGNCALYSLYQNTRQSIMPFCDASNDAATKAVENPRGAYRNSWKAINIIREELVKEVKSGEYSHLIVSMMGLDTSQEESIRNFKSIAWSIRETAHEEFEPLFIGITWPSFFDSRWLDPVWEIFAYAAKADEADRLGLSWLGVLMHEVILPISNQIHTALITHSFGSRALSMATCVGPAIKNGNKLQRRATGQIEDLIGFGAAFSLERFSNRQIPFYEDVNYPDACKNIKTFALTASNHDIAVKFAIWADLAGNYRDFKAHCASEHSYSVYCAAADQHGNVKLPPDVDPKLLYIDTTELMRYAIPGTQGGSHSDMFRPGVGRMIWTIINQHNPMQAH
ncbi:MAG: hypothetical protein AB2807_09240 [Candidatus Sedimenticola endophacoides]